MNLTELLKAGRLRKHSTSSQEIGNLLATAERDLTDATVEAVSLDRRFMAAYSGALALATIPLACAGYRPRRDHHLTVFQALPLVMGTEMQQLSEYFDTCRQKRHQALYNQVGQATASEVEELIESVATFNTQVEQWLRDNHPELVGE